MLGNQADTEKYIDKELQAIGWPRLDLSNKQQTLGCIFSLLKQRSVHRFDTFTSATSVGTLTRQVLMNFSIKFREMLDIERICSKESEYWIRTAILRMPIW